MVSFMHTEDESFISRISLYHAISYTIISLSEVFHFLQGGSEWEVYCNLTNNMYK